MGIEIKRVYDDAAPGDGFRVLVDRIWPRGVAKDDAHADAWLKDVAPSTELRKWFGHDPERMDEFASRYRAELDANDAVDELRDLARTHKTLTLLFSAKDPERNQARVLRDYLEG
ncbi:DUF488 domain-containing protein [Paramicrobacterium humi]|jgi:uncharacterized protein YeaO (DUF488 family)|nr:DUF488 domain-containing protein [Microbacterium humi]